MTIHFVFLAKSVIKDIACVFNQNSEKHFSWTKIHSLYLFFPIDKYERGSQIDTF